MNSGLDIRKGSRGAIILLNGPFGDEEIWDKIIDELHHLRQVVLPQLPVYHLGEEEQDVRHLAKALHHYIESNHLRDVVIIGHSIGGQIGLHYAYEHATNVEKIVLISSTGLIYNPPSVSGLTTKFDFNYINQKTSEAFYKPEIVPRNLKEKIYATIQNTSKRIAIWSLISSSKKNNVAKFLNHLDHKVLLIWGIEDKITPPEAALHFHDFLPNSEVRFIEQCGHVPMIEQPEIFTTHLKNFLQ